jgi:ppGpp synthetase/RelA/SpoT-type nucleotidyltranferase
MANRGSGYADVYRVYSDERPIYDRLVAVVVEKLKTAIAVAGIVAEVKGRSKEPQSFATKAIMKGYSNPLEQIGDMAGVRVMVIYADEVARVETIVREQLHVIRCESKIDALAYNEFGYLGLHCDARLEDDDEALAADSEMAGRRVEVQIRTMVQSAWAEVSHEQLYKPPADVPDELKREIHRLVALVELFDGEVTRFRERANSTPGYREALALAPLQTELLERFDVRARPDRQLSLAMAAAVVPLYGVTPEALYDDRLQAWIDNHEGALRLQFEEAQALPTNPLFLQPEAFLLFERLSNDQAHLRNAWPEEVPTAWYLELAAAWGVPDAG